MNETLEFVKQFFKRPSAVGSLVPSSKALAQEITAGLSKGQSCRMIVELGPGTGAITRLIMQKLSDISCYVGIEINPDFAAHLRQEFQGIRIIDGSASNLKESLVDAEGTVGCIISSLPFTNFTDEKTFRILQGCQSLLREGGELRFFLYLHTIFLPKNRRFLALVRKNFHLKKRKLILCNIPPAISFVFTKSALSNT